MYGAEILKQKPTVERLYWAVFSRAPTPQELKLGEDFLSDNPGPEDLGDMLWSLFASPGFTYIN